jgi:threonine dehydrogenase-like Zn-dependent dehydrogenase
MVQSNAWRTDQSTGRVAALVGRRRVEMRMFPLPPVPKDGILLAIGLTGVCGSDLHRFQDVEDTMDLALPVVMGHEISGRVVAIGPEADRQTVDGETIREGDRLVVFAGRPCGRCFWCREIGHTSRCEAPAAGYGYRYGLLDQSPHFTGGMGDYLFLEPGSWFWKIPDDVSWEVAALTEPFGMAIRTIERGTSLPSWKNEQTLAFGGTVAVLGAGAIGTLTAAAARIAGAGRIILIGAPASALATAVQAGVADETIDITEIEPSERIGRVREMTRGGYGADVVVEAAGVPSAFLEGLEMLRPLGTFVEVGCMVDNGRTVPLNVARHITQKDLTLHAVGAQPAQALGKALRTLSATQSRIDYTAFVGRVFDLEQAQQAFELMEHPVEKPVKVALRGAGY